MPLRELRSPRQMEEWLKEWGSLLTVPGEMVLIGFGALLWHAWNCGVDLPLSENSMDVDPVTDSEEIAMLGYEAMIGSDFERKHGWHVNLMPQAVLREFSADWRARAETKAVRASPCCRAFCGGFVDSKVEKRGATG